MKQFLVREDHEYFILKRSVKGLLLLAAGASTAPPKIYSTTTTTTTTSTPLTTISSTTVASLPTTTILPETTTTVKSSDAVELTTEKSKDAAELTTQKTKDAAEVITVKSSDAAELTTASFILPKEPIATATEAVVKSVSVEDNTIDIDSVVEPKKTNEAQKEEAEVEETVENDEEGSGDSVKVEKTTENQIIVTTTTSSPVTETVQATTAAAVQANIQPDATASPWERLTRVQQEEFNRKYLELRPELQEFSRQQFLSLAEDGRTHAYAAFLSLDSDTLAAVLQRELETVQQQQQEQRELQREQVGRRNLIDLYISAAQCSQSGQMCSARVEFLLTSVAHQDLR